MTEVDVDQDVVAHAPGKCTAFVRAPQSDGVLAVGVRSFRPKLSPETLTVVRSTVCALSTLRWLITGESNEN